MKLIRNLLIFILSFAMAGSLAAAPAYATEKTGENIPFYYVALGDSIGSGYDLPGSNTYTVTNPRLNYKNDPVQCYPHILAEEFANLYDYDGDIYDIYSNMCLAAATTADYINILNDPEAYVVNEAYFGHSADSLKVHDLLIDEIKKADVITVNAGNNDMITDAIYVLAEAGTGVKAPRRAGKNRYWTNSEGKTIEVFDHIKNPILTAVWLQITKMSQGITLDPQTSAQEVMDFLEYYMSDETVDPLTIEDVIEAVQYLSTDNLSNVMTELALEGAAIYPTLIDDLREVNNDAELYILGFYAAFGNSLTVDGTTYDGSTVMEIVNKYIVQDAVKYNALTGYSAEEYLQKVVSDCMGELTYPLIYLLMGQCTDAGVKAFNEFMVEYCAENDLTYIDIYNIPNENDTDPHPNESGHQYIADQCYEAMSNEVNVTVEGSDNTTVEGKNLILGNVDNIYTIYPEKGYMVDRVTVNGESVEVIDDQFIVNADQDASVVVTMKNIFPFIDVPENKWYRPYVEAVYELGLMTGTSETIFSPSDSITRGQLATILYRMAGSPEVEDTESFEDVAQGKYYTNAIAWCKATGVVAGYKDGTFKPSQAITRQELALMLMRYANSLGKKGEVDENRLAAYPDMKEISGWAVEGMAWAVTNSLIYGDQGNLNPKGTATRGQSAKMILAVYNLINQE